LLLDSNSAICELLVWRGVLFLGRFHNSHSARYVPFCSSAGAVSLAEGHTSQQYSSIEDLEDYITMLLAIRSSQEDGHML
jgi:hypothetical protein